MKFAWRNKIENLATRNSEQVEEVDIGNLNEYTDMLDMDETATEFERVEDEFIMLD